jgi:LPXTG-site transpeptidase (sortase) family protein
MAKNPLFPGDATAGDEAGRSTSAYSLHARQNVIQPLSDTEKSQISANPAADLIREKLERLYSTEPDALAEEREVQLAPARSKHQEFMYRLSTSGKGLAEIQTEWHAYYQSLPDDEKHQVWQEFYANNAPGAQPALSDPAPKRAKEIVTNQASQAAEQRVVVADHTPKPMEATAPKAKTPAKENRTANAIRQAIRKRIESRTSRLSTDTKQNIKSLAFGLTVGLVVLFVFLFSFFNEVVIAPFIQPGRTSATPIIVSSESVDASVPSVIIPKINVQIPTVYNVPDNSEAAIQAGLESGVVHYPTTVTPGQKGNAAFFGHSSNNIFNKGKYKFAFVLLHKLQEGDTFYLTYNGTVYGYKVITTKIVSPDQVDVLNNVPGEDATATLITCDPPGTTLNRLVVVGRQVSPDPAANTSAAAPTEGSSAELPGNGPTLWTRLWRSVF